MARCSLGGGLGRHAGDIGELACRQRAAFDQRNQNVGAGWIADQRGDLRYRGLALCSWSTDKPNSAGLASRNTSGIPETMPRTIASRVRYAGKRMEPNID